MKAAILCPGPNLLKTWPGAEGFDLIIAVNRAGLVCQHDWLMMMDNNEIARNIVANCTPRVGYLFPPHVQHLAWNKGLPIRNPWTARPPKHVLRPARLTGPSALQVAVEMGSSDIHVFGCDLTGKHYANGEETPGDLEVRWSAEQRIWDRVVNYLKEFGHKVTFHRITDGNMDCNTGNTH